MHCIKKLKRRLLFSTAGQGGRSRQNPVELSLRNFKVNLNSNSASHPNLHPNFGSHCRRKANLRPNQFAESLFDHYNMAVQIYLLAKLEASQV